jgi:hypothetical protein
MSQIIKPPTKITPAHLEKISLFLGGSIEMGAAENWQDRVSTVLSEQDIVIFNPRRDDWDSTWIQHPDNSQFSEQVHWELEAQDLCDIICYYFDPNTKSPITLLELGLYASKNKHPGQSVVVYCPEKYWRFGNVKIVCDAKGIVCVGEWSEFIRELSNSINKSREYYFRT